MSHIQSLSEQQDKCETLGDCREYQLQLANQDSQIDARTAAQNQGAITWGILIALFGLSILLLPYSKLLQRIQGFTLPKLVVIGPVLAGLAAGAFGGFAIAFSACYKQQCSPVESTAIFTLPLFSLVLTIPIAMKIAAKQRSMAATISSPKVLHCTIIGSIIIVLALISTVSRVSENKRINASQKNYLRSIEQ